ncbi:Odorant receptor [Operophtera brumata]|uniref:Odorant receptor n=1 Tax=Operophtera brumata TaxID=104452 RepID=A0A0L7LEP8_OPEBR|nr:Odorant receptor [Operophtera brumata]
MDETFRTFHRVLSFAGVPIFARENWSSKPWLLLQILNFIIGVLCFVFTTSFVANNYSNLLLFIQGACIWTTGMNSGKKLMELRSLVEESQANLLKYTRLLLKSYVASLIRQLRILTFILLHLDELMMEISGNDAVRWQQCCTAALTQCVDHYNKLSPDTMKYYVHEFCFILVVLVFCLLGQQVDNESALLERAVSEKWYIFDRKHKKSVLIFNMALSQRMPIYIFGTITLSLPTFTWVS